MAPALDNKSTTADVGRQNVDTAETRRGFLLLLYVCGG